MTLILCLPVFPNNYLSLLCDVSLLLPVPKVEEAEQKDEYKRVGGHGAHVEEGVQLAQEVATVPTGEIDGLIEREMNFVGNIFHNTTKPLQNYSSRQCLVQTTFKWHCVLIK